MRPDHARALGFIVVTTVLLVKLAILGAVFDWI